MLGADIVAKARGDAHIVMISSAASHGIGPVLYKNVPYDPLADFTHIHLVGTFPTVLAVNRTSPIGSVQELIDLARAKPGEVTYGSGGNGTMNHLIGQLLARAAGIDFTHIPYRGSAPAMNDVMGGQITALMESLPTAMRLLRVPAHAAAGDQRGRARAALPDVPTFREAGFPGRGDQLVRLLRAGRHPARDRQALGGGDRRGPASPPVRSASTRSASGPARSAPRPTPR